MFSSKIVHVKILNFTTHALSIAKLFICQLLLYIPCHKLVVVVYVTHHAIRDLVGIANSIDPGQPAQADHSRNFSLLADFLCINSFQTSPGFHVFRKHYEKEKLLKMSNFSFFPQRFLPV